MVKRKIILEITIEEQRVLKDAIANELEKISYFNKKELEILNNFWMVLK